MRRVLGWAATAAALAALAAGCGGSSLDPVAKAATKSGDLGSAKLTMAVSASVPGSPTPVLVNGTGAFSKQGGTMSLDLATQGKTQHLDEVFLGNGGKPVVYVRSPLFAGQLPAGKSWVRVDVAAAAKRQGLDLGSLTSPTGGSPSDALAILRQTSGTVTKVGADTIDGVATTHYTATVDLQKVAAAKPAERQALDRLAKLTGRSTFPVDAWIDGQGLVRRIRYAVQLPPAQGGASVTTTMTLSDYGAPVTVTAPPADQVWDAPTG